MNTSSAYRAKCVAVPRRHLGQQPDTLAHLSAHKMHGYSSSWSTELVKQTRYVVWGEDSLEAGKTVQYNDLLTTRMVAKLLTL